MQAVYIENNFGLENLTIKSLLDSKKELDDYEVRVRIHAVSLNYRDYLMVTGKYNPRQKLPLIPCSDGAGEVIEVGKKVTQWKVGDRVCGIFAQEWWDGPPNYKNLRSTLGGPLDGMLVQERIFNEQGLVSIPKNLSYEEASTLPCAALTAYNAVVTYGNVKPGSSVLILGTGGVSIFALQFAKAMGCETIVTSSSEEKLHRATQLGANHTINYTSRQNWEREVKKITNMNGCDLVIEVGGAGTLPKSMMAVRPGGTIALIGVLAGGEGNLSLYPILMQGVCMQGIIVGNKRQFQEMNRAIETNQIHPVVDKIFPLEDYLPAFRHMESGSHFGKIVIRL